MSLHDRFLPLTNKNAQLPRSRAVIEENFRRGQKRQSNACGSFTLLFLGITGEGALGMLGFRLKGEHDSWVDPAMGSVTQKIARRTHQG